MGKRCWTVPVLVLVLALGLLAAACGGTVKETTAQQATTTTAGITGIQGRAYYADTEEPISGASIRLNDSTSAEANPSLTTAETTTDADGSYSFVNILPGTYEISFILVTTTGVSSIECTENTSSFLNSFEGVSQDGSTRMNALYPEVEVPAGNTVTEDFIVHR